MMARVAKAAPATVAIRNGSYDGLLYLRGKDRLTIRGESRDGVLLYGTNNDGLNPGSGNGQPLRTPGAAGGRALFLIEAADLVGIESLTIKNDTVRARVAGGQAEALLFNDEAGRLVVKNASFFSEQDTIQVKGYSWFYDTLIAGNVDFIWGNNRVALFEASELRSVGDSANRASGGYLVQARTMRPGDKGFVFLDSRFTHGPGPAGNDVPPGATYLARSPGTPNTWDHVSFINCRMDAHIAPVGWAGKGVQREPAPNPPAPSAAAGWREYGTRDLAGRPLDLSRRVGGYVLSAQEAAAQFGSRAAIFAGFEGKDGTRGWDPR
jgi:pectin methylesterase-like acyl-CoA thioesterase